MSKTNRSKKGCIIGVAVVLVGIGLVISSGGGDKGEDKQKGKKEVYVDSAVSSVDNKKSIEKTDNKEKNNTTLEKQTLWETDNVKIKTDGLVDDSIFGKAISINTENNSDKDIGIGVDALIVNDYMISDLTSIKVAAGKKSNDKINIFASELKKAGIDNIGKIEIYMHTFDPETYEKKKSSKCITLKTSDYDKMDLESNIKGSVLYDKNDVKIVAQYVDEDSLWGKSVLLYIENNSKKTIHVSCDNLSVNGYMVTELFSAEIYSGKKIFDSIELLQSDLDENNIDKINEIETEFKITDSKYKTIAESGKVKFKTK